MRSPKPRCSRQRCTYIASLPSGLCRKHLKAECDRLFSLKIRERGECESGRDTHNGAFQCAHGFSRRYLSIRWDDRNAFCFCAGCHTYYTNHPDEWSWWLQDEWGVRYWLMQNLAQQTTQKIDLEAVYKELTA